MCIDTHTHTISEKYRNLPTVLIIASTSMTKMRGLGLMIRIPSETLHNTRTHTQL